MSANSARAKRSVLLLGNYRPTLTVARTLAGDGFNVVLGLDDDPAGSAQHSRHVHEIWDHPGLHVDEGLAFGTALRAVLASRPDIGILYPVTEAMVRWMAENEARLPANVLVASPPAAVVLPCLDKLRMAECATLEDVPCQPFAAVSSVDELRISADRLGYPLVIRPLDHLLRIGVKKAVIVTGPAHLAETLPAWPEGHHALLLQTFARGERRDLYFAADGGHIFRFLEARIVRTDSYDGTGLSVEGEIVEPSRLLTEYTARMARRLGYSGIGCAQFLVDRATGHVSFLEINPRIAGSHRCTEEMGMDLTRLSIALAAKTAAGQKAAAFAYPAGARYAWTYGDLGGLKGALASREIGAFRAIAWLARAAKTFLRADFHLSWDRADPWPTLLLFASQLPGLRWLARTRSSRVAAARRDEGHEGPSSSPSPLSGKETAFRPTP